MQFNDDALGRCLDAISDHGTTKLFSNLVFEIGTEYKLFSHTTHVDAMTNGYSKDDRPDLKQMLLNLATTGANSFPIWMEAHSGNASDQKVILQRAAVHMKAFCALLKGAPSFLFVADSTIYEKCIQETKNSKSDRSLHWLSRVPHTVKEVEALLVLSDKAQNWTQLVDPEILSTINIFSLKELITNIFKII